MYSDFKIEHQLNPPDNARLIIIGWHANDIGNSIDSANKEIENSEKYKSVFALFHYDYCCFLKHFGFIDPFILLKNNTAVSKYHYRLFRLGMLPSLLKDTSLIEICPNPGGMNNPNYKDWENFINTNNANAKQYIQWLQNSVFNNCQNKVYLIVGGKATTDSLIFLQKKHIIKMCNFRHYLDLIKHLSAYGGATYIDIENMRKDLKSIFQNEISTNTEQQMDAEIKKIKNNFFSKSYFLPNPSVIL